MSRKWRSIPRIAMAKTPTQATVTQRQHTLGQLQKNTFAVSFQVVDTAVTQLKLRCGQPGLHTYMQLENIKIAADKDWWIEDRHICISGDGRWPASHTTGNDATTELASGVGGW